MSGGGLHRVPHSPTLSFIVVGHNTYQHMPYPVANIDCTHAESASASFTYLVTVSPEVRTPHTEQLNRACIIHYSYISAHAIFTQFYMSANLITSLINNTNHTFFLLQWRNRAVTAMHLESSGTKVFMNGSIVHKLSVGEKEKLRTMKMNFKINFHTYKS